MDMFICLLQKLHCSADTPCSNIVTLSKALSWTLESCFGSLRDRKLLPIAILSAVKLEGGRGAKVVRSYYDARCALKPRPELHTIDLNRNAK